MLHFEINPHSGLPVYRQLIDQIKYYVASGLLKSGDQLPSIREFALTLAINPTTVVRVYTDLERDGIIEVQHGRGAFVAANKVRLPASERDRKLRGLARSLAVEATQMGVPAAQIVKALREELAELQDSDVFEMPPKVTVVPKKLSA